MVRQPLGSSPTRRPESRAAMLKQVPMVPFMYVPLCLGVGPGKKCQSSHGTGDVLAELLKRHVNITFPDRERCKSTRLMYVDDTYIYKDYINIIYMNILK